MSDKDEIKELFQKELGNYEAKVDPSLWNGIQSGLSGGSAAGGSAAGMAVLTKAVITIAVATVATLSVVMIFTEEKPVKNKEENIVNIESSTDDKREVVSNDNNDSEIRGEIEVPITENIEEKITKKVNENPTVELIEIEQIKTTDTKRIETVLNSKENTYHALIESNEKKEDKVKDAKENTELKELSAEILIIEKDNQYVKFGSIVENAEDIYWSFGDGSTSSDFAPEHFYEDPGTYYIVATIYGKNKSIEKQLQIEVKVEGKFTKLPNIFSPNNDGSNDEFFVEYEGIEEFQLNIFNQSQELIYTTNNVDFKWRGVDLKGNLVQPGNYIYVIMAKDKAGNVINKYEKLAVTR